MGRIDAFGRVAVDEDGLVEALLRGADLRDVVPDAETRRRLEQAAASVDAETFLPPDPDVSPSVWHLRRGSRPLEHVPEFDEIVEPIVDSTEDPDRKRRLVEEIRLFRELDLEVVVRMALLVVETARRTGVVLGPGRGSSCASLLLHMIGLHLVDPIEAGIPATEFLRPDNARRITEDTSSDGH